MNDFNNIRFDRLDHSVQNGVNYRVNELLTVLSRERVMEKKNPVVIFNLLEVLFNELYHKLDDEDKKKGTQALTKLSEELQKVKDGKSRHSFSSLSSTFERELRNFVHTKLTENKEV